MNLIMFTCGESVYWPNIIHRFMETAGYVGYINMDIFYMLRNR